MSWSAHVLCAHRTTSTKGRSSKSAGLPVHCLEALGLEQCPSAVMKISKQPFQVIKIDVAGETGSKLGHTTPPAARQKNESKMGSFRSRVNSTDRTVGRGLKLTLLQHNFSRLGFENGGARGCHEWQISSVSKRDRTLKLLVLNFWERETQYL